MPRKAPKNIKRFNKPKKTTFFVMLVLQPTSICFLKRFLTAMHSGKIYIRHLFRYGQLRQSHLAQKDLLVVEIIGSTKYTLSIANTGKTSKLSYGYETYRNVRSSQKATFNARLIFLSKNKLNKRQQFSFQCSYIVFGPVFIDSSRSNVLDLL